MKKFVKFFNKITDRVTDEYEKVVDSNARQTHKEQKIVVKLKELLGGKKDKLADNIKKLLQNPKTPVDTLNFSLIKNHKKFSSLKVFFSFSEMEILFPILHECKDLKNLNFSNLKFSNSFLFLLGDLLNKNKNIKKVNISGNEFTSLAKFVKNLSEKEEFFGLEELDISNNKLGDQGIEELSTIIGKFSKTLKVLNVSSCAFSSKGFGSLIKSLESCTVLEDIDIGKNTIIDGSNDDFLNLVEKLKSLQVLRMSRISKGNIDVFIGGLLKKLKDHSLMELRLNANVITNEGIKSIGEYVKENKTLKVLRLSFNAGVNDEGIKNLCEHLKDNTTLSHLRLFYFKAITEKSYEEVGKLVNNNKALTHLAIATPGKVNFGIKEISKCLADNKSLQSLELGNVDDEGCNILKKGLEANTTLMSIAVEGRSKLKVESRKMIMTLIKKNNKDFVF